MSNQISHIGPQFQCNQWDLYNMEQQKVVKSDEIPTPAYFDEALKLVSENEGRRLFVYDDATGDPITPGYTLVGYPTIADGRELSMTGLMEGECDMLTLNSIRRKNKRLLQQGLAFFDGLNEWRQAVLIDMSYNMGVNSLMGFTGMMGELALAVKHGGKTNDFYHGAAKELKDSHYFVEVKSRGKQNYCIVQFGRYFSDWQAQKYFQSKNKF